MKYINDKSKYSKSILHHSHEYSSIDNGDTSDSLTQFYVDKLLKYEQILSEHNITKRVLFDIVNKNKKFDAHPGEMVTMGKASAQYIMARTRIQITSWYTWLL
jgi:carboxylesterase type B